MKIANLLYIPIALLLMFSPLHGQEKKRYSHTAVAREVLKKYKEMKTYSADFRITTVKKRRTQTMVGRFYYQKPDKIRFNFSDPSGNLMVSDGKILWIYIRRLNAVGKQDLSLKRKDESGRQIFAGVPGPGLTRLFRKYHYHFDDVNQPRMFDGRNLFVLDMVQREKIGGYENITLYINASTYFIYRAVADDGYGNKTTLTFSNPRINMSFEGKLFQYAPGRNVKIVNNPLVNE